MRVNPNYWKERQEELRRYDFKMGRQLRDLLPEPEPIPDQSILKEIPQSVLIDKINRLQAELVYTRKKLDEHLDTHKIQYSLKTSGKI